MARRTPPPADLRTDEAWGLLRICNKRGVVLAESWARLQLHTGALLLADPVSVMLFDFEWDVFTFRFDQAQHTFRVQEWESGTQPDVYFCLEDDLGLAREAWAQRMAKRMGDGGNPRQAGPRL